MTSFLSRLVKEKKVIVCCGAGGVGKTTTAAALGLAGAQAGRRVLVLTIDPAKRLAQAMGLSEHMREPTPVATEQLRKANIVEGTLDAWMLHSEIVFQNLVRRMAPTPEHAQRVLDSRLFRRLCELMAGMQEYTAAEALYELSTSDRYDLVVLDTPPARNALDFLEAPGKLMKFLDEKILALFLPKTTGGLFKKAAELLGSVFTKIFGGDFFLELQDFLSSMSGLFAPMRHHAEGVRTLLTSSQTAFLLVTSPDQAALTDARYFRDKIATLQLPFGGFILNRSWASTEGLADFSTEQWSELAAPSGLAEKWRGLVAKEHSHIARDKALATQLTKEVPDGVGVFAAPYLGDAIEDISGLAQLAQGLTA